jgi:hypothetical protein
MLPALLILFSDSKLVFYDLGRLMAKAKSRSADIPVGIARKHAKKRFLLVKKRLMPDAFSTHIVDADRDVGDPVNML